MSDLKIWFEKAEATTQRSFGKKIFWNLQILKQYVWRSADL